MREMVGGCCVCSDDRGWSENPLVYCDGQSCNVAVHQACYGIVTVPTGPWYCRKCESQERSVKVKCELCPSRYGALKRTDNSGWAHVVCALYIPEVRFGNVTTMEPIQLQLIPSERFNKNCYICEEKGKPANATVGACMQCNKVGCKQQFHVTCAQSLGLLCEEAGNYLDNVKYCGYCQHHYGKLKKGGNVKTIPPYKPVSDSHNSDSNSEKESEGSSKRSSSPSSGRRKTGSASKSNSSKVAASSSNKSASQPKTVHNNNKGTSEKAKTVNSKSAKSEETFNADAQPIDKNDKKDNAKSDTLPENDITKEAKDKDGKSAKKRKVNSRTPTPVQSEVSVVVSIATSSPLTGIPTTSSATPSINTEKRNVSASVADITTEKVKKLKIETTQSIISNQPIVALTSISNLTPSSVTTVKASSPVAVVTESSVTSDISTPMVATPSIIQSAQAQAAHQQQIGSLVVSVPLASTSLSPHNPIINNQTSVLAVTPFQSHMSERVSNTSTSVPDNVPNIMESDSLLNVNDTTEDRVLTSEMSGGGLKITYEKQPDSINMEVDMELEVDPTLPELDIPVRRGRSQSNEKVERTTRAAKKRNSTNGTPQPPSGSTTLPKRSSRSQHSTPPPQPHQSGAFSAITESQIKDSPPSSPSSESQGAPPSSSSRGRTKGRKSAPAAVNLPPSKDNKDVKLFQNGVTTAPHMLGNQLNPSSNMHQKMTDHLSAEMEAHSIYHNSNDTSPVLVGPQLHHRVVQSARASSTGSSTASGGSGLSSVLGNGGGTIPQTLDQLLERQWEQGSQFLMEQAQHFDIASLLSCLHQLRAENLRLEEHVSSLLQRRDHLLAVNARLAIPLTNQPATPQPPHPHTVNNIHQNMSVNHGDMPRPPRHNSGNYERHSQSSQHGPIENGLPPDGYPQNPRRSPVNSGQPSPTVRW